MSCPQIWNIEQEKEREKESRRQAAKLNAKKGDRDLQRERKNKGDIFWLEEQHENLAAAITN